MDKCPLCGAPLRWWDRTQPTQCFGCKAMIQPSPPSLFDVNAGEALRDEAIQRVDENAEPDIRTELLVSVRRVAVVRRELTSDDVWIDFRSHNTDIPHEPRLLGAVMRAAQKEGYIAPTDRFAPSNRPETHRSPKRVWASRVFQG